MTINEASRIRFAVFSAKQNKDFASYVKSLLTIPESDGTKIKWLKDYIEKQRMDLQTYEQSLSWENEE